MGAPRLFCFGRGYTALRLARLVQAEGWLVAGTSRSPERIRQLAAEGIEAHRFGGDGPLEGYRDLLFGTTHLLVSVPPGDAGDPVLACHREDLARMAPGLTWVGYLSTTGVYGDRKGDWVDENTPVSPGSPRAKRRADAEQGWLDLWRSNGLPVHVFRLPGIYGPGRSALDAVRAGRAHRIDKPGQVFSRIHVDDIATVLRASMAQPNPGSIYNVADDEPAPAHEVTAYACRLLAIEPPPLVRLDQAELSPMARSFYAESRRVRNDRIKQELGVRLAYPDYRAGLRAILAGEEVVTSRPR